MGRIKRYIKNKIFNFFRNIKLKKMKKELKNTSISIICSDCLAGRIYHDLGLEFKSPTINLYIKPKDFVKLCGNLKYYFSLDLKEEKNAHPNCSVGRLDDILIYFLHYNSFDEAKEKWNERKQRVDFDNICYILTCKDGFTEDDVFQFNKLPIKNKIVFTDKLYPDIKCGVYIKECVKNGEVQFMGYEQNIFGKRFFDNFDIVKFINNVGENNGKD